MKDKSIDGPGTPLPWVVGDGEDIWDTLSNGEPGIPMFRADVGPSRSWGRDIGRTELLANARYIVWSANNAPALVEALQAIAHLRPAGDCKNALIIQMERIALNALSTALGEMNDE